MPSRNIVKQYVEGGYYHVYNRGVEKRDIFLDAKDYQMFLRYLRAYFTDERLFARGRPRPNLSSTLDIISYCLMPNHFHLLLRQSSERDMVRLIHGAMTGYVMYFNLRHKRVGALFQDTYKAAMVDTDEYLAHISRYIHRNSSALGISPFDYDYSNLNCFATEAISWTNPQPILELFADRASYIGFVKDESVVDTFELSEDFES
jgi:putative transposase